MTARITPRVGRAIERVSLDQYGAFYTGHYRGERNVWLVLAKSHPDSASRAQHIQFAINAHRSMMRCLREARREQRMQQEAA